MSLIAIAMYTKWTPCPQRASRLAMVENVWRRTNLLERLTYSLFLLSVSNLSSSIFPGVCPAWTSFSNLCFANITSTVAWLKYRTFARTVKRFRARADAYTNKESLREREGGEMRENWWVHFFATLTWTVSCKPHERSGFSMMYVAKETEERTAPKRKYFGNNLLWIKPNVCLGRCLYIVKPVKITKNNEIFKFIGILIIFIALNNTTSQTYQQRM